MNGIVQGFWIDFDYHTHKCQPAKQSMISTKKNTLIVEEYLFKGREAGKLDALKSLLRPFWDKGAVVATWLSEYCIQFLDVHIINVKFPKRKVLLKPPLHCWLYINKKTNCELSSP